MRDLLRRQARFFAAFTVVALALRLFFVFRFPHIAGDSFVYGDIAKNWLQHGVFGQTDVEGPVPTYIRLPGYPAFLAAVFAVFGMEHYRAVLVLQALLDVGTCFVVADLARRTVGERGARWAFALSALCPFLADYAAAPLTETISIFFTAVALDFTIKAFDHTADRRQQAGGEFALAGLATGATILLRPDGGILLAAIGVYSMLVLVRGPARRKIVTGAVLLATMALAPLAPWTWRNWREFHEFQPLAPRYANAAEEFAPRGFIRWVRTWIVDYVSVEDIFWNVPDTEIDVGLLPSRAFDSAEQRRRTAELFAEYNLTRKMTPALDWQFEQLARWRINTHPLRYYLVLPLARAADMWLRPRTEMLPVTPRWWEFRQDPHDATWAALLAAVNLFYLVAALLGLRKDVRHKALLVTFVLLRTAFLGSLENPEPRYTLECFPVVLVLAAAALARTKPAGNYLPWVRGLVTRKDRTPNRRARHKAPP